LLNFAIEREDGGLSFCSVGEQQLVRMLHAYRNGRNWLRCKIIPSELFGMLWAAAIIILSTLDSIFEVGSAGLVVLQATPPAMTPTTKPMAKPASKPAVAQKSRATKP